MKKLSLKHLVPPSPWKPSGVRWLAPVLVAVLIGTVPLAAEETAPQKDPQQVELEKMVKQAARRIEYTLKKEGYFSARVALNVWKSTAIDAGLYDQATYDAYRKRVYQGSIDANRRWFEDYLKDNNLRNAGTCLEFWRLHSLELGVLDPEEYQTLKTRLHEAQQKKAAP